MHSISTEQHYSFPIAKAQEWHQQRDVSNPNSEAEAGINFAGGKDNLDDDDDVGCEDFLKLCTTDPNEEHDEMSADLHKCGIHLAQAKMHQMCGNHEEAIKSLNKSMTHFARFHKALKGATEDN
jgi:hypothetical protein